MEETNSNLKEVTPVPASVPAPVASVPEAAPVSAPAPAVTVTPAVKVAATPTPAPSGPVELPKTTGKTPGGWNRFAGYNPAEAKNKKDNRRGDSSKGRR
jgi:hypothetical protein